MNRIVVAGASLAGVNAAHALREAGYDGEVVLLGAQEQLPYDRPPLSKEALLADTEPEALALRPAGWYADQGISLRLRTVAAALDTGRRRLTLADGTGISYDGLILATGAAPAALPPEHRAPGVLTLRHFEDMVALRQALAPGVRLLVIGAGFIGLEVGATARTIGAEVTVIEVAAVPLARALGEDVGGWLAARHREQGADVRCGRTVQRLTGGPGGYRARLSDGSVLCCDVVVAATGVRPATGWLRGSGLRLGDGVRCDSYCRTSAPGVVAAGDVARWYNPLFDEDMRIEHWTNAVEQGRAAALSLLGLAASAYAPVPYFWSDHYGLRIRFAGRAFAASGVHIDDRGDGSLVALYRRDGVIRGVLCVGAMRELAVRRQQILGQERWEDVVPGNTLTATARKSTRLSNPSGSGCSLGSRGKATAAIGREVPRMYGLHKLLWELRRDPALAARFRADAAAVTDLYDLTSQERAAMINRDFQFLFRNGANPYLLYFCALQIGVSRDAYYAQLRGEPAPQAG